MNTIYFRGFEPPIAGISAAHGLNGQHIFVWPREDVVLVVFSKYAHDASQGYVLSTLNYPDTCTARNRCRWSVGEPVQTYNEYELLGHMAGLPLR